MTEAKKPGWSIATIPQIISETGVFADGDWVESKDQDPNGEVRLIQLADIGIGDFRDKSARFLTLEKAQALRCTFLKAGDILVARMPDPLGRACIFPLTGKFVTVVDVAIIRTGANGVDRRWLMHIINSPVIQGEIFNLASGSTRLRISRGNLSTIALPIPPLAEQKRIVAKLDEAFKHLETVKAKLERIPKLLKKFRQTVLTHAVTGKITGILGHEGLVGVSPIVIGEHTHPAPNGWEWVKLVEIAKLESGHTPRKSVEEYWENGNIPWISLQDIRAAHGKIITKTKFMPTQRGIDKSSARLLPAGTVCFSRDISVGFTTIMGREMATTQHFANWICGERISNLYLLYAFMASRYSLISSGTGTTVGTIYMPALKDMRLLLPPLDQQRQIVEMVQLLFTKSDMMEDVYKGIKVKIDKLPQALLAKAFRGELVSQNESDEPASVLLEKINEAKTLTGKVKKLYKAVEEEMSMVAEN